VVVTADPAECSFQFNPTGTEVHQLVRHRQAGAGRSSVSYENAPPTGPAVIKVGETVVPSSYRSQGQGPSRRAKPRRRPRRSSRRTVADALKAAGYPAKADPAKIDKVMVIAILTYLVIW
jgi:hypothetical protein